MKTKKEMIEKLNKNREKLRDSIRINEEIDTTDLPDGPHFSPTNEIDIQRRKKEITSKK